ncbi:nucleosome-remodeling factor subunit NURF301 isoform X2 [Cylas formicarius]|uniref:nucleosome-remodeling factor subunit NURF301 isoform X2 n=1 Tax=Cylas formicarius TaxID=197179 RepID=UPI002958BF39|nr:nucleosome-remodeling factor subunit NURF301 isoform X2 [Cylas formicarius]
MSARGMKKRGRPPKVQVAERARKFQYHLLKKPKYLLNYQKKESDSQYSTPSASRASSPHDSESHRRSSNRIRGKDGHRASRKTNYVGSAYQRRGYNPSYSDYHDSEYHYGSDFGDESSDNKSEIEDELGISESESIDSVGGQSSDSDFSLSSFSTMSGTPRKPNVNANRAPTPEPLWLQNREIPFLHLPKSSDDLVVPKDRIMEVISIYEVLRHFRNLVRLSPFRLEDFCAAIMCEDQSSLLAEIHIMLLKALLREEDSQQTHFGPLDQKDSVNITLFLIDYVTYPEVLRSYVESDKSFDQRILSILNTTDYPFSCLEDRIKVLQFLTDQFLITNPVREDLLSEVPMHYDDHCRVCHKLGDLLCCETCPAVYHLECVDPPLVNVPDEDWQCGICRSHKVSGVVDCVLDSEKQGQLSRQEPLGHDRHGRKYFFLCRRVFVEASDGEVWYYSTPLQFKEMLKVFDVDDMESRLVRELQEYKCEIIRQMELTEKLTNQYKGNKKAYLDVENLAILKANKEKDEKSEEESKEKERKIAEDMVAKMHEESSDILGADAMQIDIPSVVHNEIVSTTLESENCEDNMRLEKNCTDDEDDRGNENVTTRSKMGSVTTRTSNVDDFKRKGTPILGREESEREESRITRLRSSQMANGTYLFKLGMENTFKSYVNQFTTNLIALNKPQRNEERDKKRHLSHKFSLTTASEFKWIGGMNGAKTLLMNTLRHTISHLEQAIPSSFMHPNWHLVRKHWLNIIAGCQKPKDFAKALIVLQACIKPVCFANVWHDQLGHVKLVRMTAQEREERKKIEKREKKEREEEEERNRLIVSGYVKYTMGFKHQLWKQKGEEYRIHGRWGWLWIRIPRNYRIIDSSRLGLAAGPHRYFIQIRDKNGQRKIVALSPNMYKFLMNRITNEKCEEDISNNEPQVEIPEILRNIEVVPMCAEFQHIDVSKALSAPGRLLYPKVAKKGILDELLSRRVQLKVIEERKIAQSKSEDVQKEEENPDAEVEEDSTPEAIDKQLNNMMSGKVTLPYTSTSATPVANRDVLNSIAKRIHALRTQYTSISKLAKDFQCYGRGCNSGNSTNLDNNCYSPLCIQRVKIRRDLLQLLRRANLATNNSSSGKLNLINQISGTPAKKASSILEQSLKAPHTNNKQKEIDKPSQASICKDLVDAVMSATSVEEETKGVYIPAKQLILDEVKEEKLESKHCLMDLKQEPPTGEIDVIGSSPSPKKIKLTKSESDEVDVKDMTPDAIKEMIIGSNKSDVTQVITTTTTTITTSKTLVDGVIKSEAASQNTTQVVSVTSASSANGTGRTIQTLNAKNVTYSAQQNRRFCAYKIGVKREEKIVKTEHAEDGSERIYSVTSTEGKMFLKKVLNQADLKRRKRQIIKYPACSTFQSRRGVNSLFVLANHDVRKLARNGGRMQVPGYNMLAKQNNSVWPYPCARPLFKTCWIYRTVNLKTLAAAALQLKTLWACLRWDDMQTKPPNAEGKHQITTETEILSLELLKHRHIGQFMEKTQYLRRKVVIPLELPKTVREVTSIRSGLRKRKRPESPQSMDPQVSEEWVDEEKLELWEIKQYGEKSRTGNLPPARPVVASETVELSKVAVTGKATPEEIKEKMEQQLRLQRAAHQQKRSLEVKNLNVKPGTVLEMVGATTGATTASVSTKPTTTNPSLKPIQPKVTTGDGPIKLVKNVVVPNQHVISGKNTLTSLLTNSSKLSGRRILMTKGPDGTTRLIAGGSANLVPKTVPGVQQQSLIKIQTTNGAQVQAVQIQPVTPSLSSSTTATKETPQRVQVMRTSDGRITVKGLLPGQQLVQFPDGKLQVLTTAQLQSAANIQQSKISSSTPCTVTKTVVKPSVTTTAQTGSKVVLQSAQVKLQPQQQTIVTQQVLQPSPIKQAIVKQQNTPVVQKVGHTGVVVSSGQIIQQQVVLGGNQVIATQGGQQIITNQIVVNNQNLAQQIATGKVQVATINGQQVLIRPTGNNQAQVVAQLAPGSVTQTLQMSSPVVAAQSPGPLKSITSSINAQLITPTQTSQNVQSLHQQVVQSPVKQSSDNQIDKATMDHLLAGQPAGTVIKCVTAQVIQTQQGPRIVLQGLQGADFTPQQLAAVQQQVKQQLLKAQASTGKQGVLGPTKIYLAVQPSSVESSEQPSSSNPPPLTPVKQNTVTKHILQTTLASPSPIKQQPAVPVQTFDTAASTVRQAVANGQQTQTSALLQAMKTNLEQNQQPALVNNNLKPSTVAATPDQNKQFVVTPDYIQQTIKTALKQENLNPEIEEKLLQLQRYQEKQMKQEPDNCPSPLPKVIASPVVSAARLVPPTRKRPPSISKSDDSEWVMETPKRTRPNRTSESKKTDSDVQSENISKEKVVSPRAKMKSKELPDPDKKVSMKAKVMVSLYRQKELLKKDILRKRALLEKELQYEIQKEVAEELAARTKIERNKQDEVRTGSSKRKSAATTTTAAIPVVKQTSMSNRHKKSQKSNSSPNPGGHRGLKKEKLYCLCRTPYDETKFYVGCDLCNNWFHGDCVNITEEMSKTLTEFVCEECKQARESQKLYCLCQQPYDDSQFYICCDSCQDWFHGRCVGILQSEADNIDEYVCPRCQRNSSVNYANMKDLAQKDYDNLRKLIKQIQAHKSAWPFMEPVDPTEAPDYYKVIKEPMDLQMIENRINDKTYTKLSEFIGDMTKIFDNCRYYNPKESPFFKCAESLEAYFVNKIKCLRDKLFENNK